MKSRRSPVNMPSVILSVAPLARLQGNPLNTRIYDRDKVERAIKHHSTFQLPFGVFIDENDLILGGYENFKAAEAFGFDTLVTKRANPPLSLPEKQIYLIKDGHQAVAALFGAKLQSIQ